MQAKYKAAGSEPAAWRKPFNTCNSKQNKRIKPAYYQDFIRYENTDLILFTNDWNILNWLRRLGSRICLLCEDNPQKYDLSFCWEKEAWVFYHQESFKSALNLSHTIQRNGAKKIDMISIDIKNLQEVSNDRK